MKAVIMAGGEGSRLRPLTCGIPKPLVPVLNKPVMWHIVNLLKQHGFSQIGVTLQYLPEEIRNYFGSGSDLGVNFKYFVESSPLGTAGSVKNAQSFLDETFLVISGDALTDFDLSAALAFHKEKKALVTLVLTKVSVPLEYGVVITDAHHQITQFLEKPSWGEVFSDTVNTGIYIMEPEVLSYIPDQTKFDFSKDLFPLLMKLGQPMYGMTLTGYWCDIGDLKQYLQAQQDFLTGQVKLPIEGREVKAGVWVEPRVQIHPSAQIKGSVLIGADTVVEKGVKIEGCTVIGSGCLIKAHASIKKSVLWNHVLVDSNAGLRGAIVGSRVKVQNASAIYEGAVVGSDCVVQERCVIKPDVKLWPSKLVEKGAQVGESLIWGAKTQKRVFGLEGVSGQVNVEITPELACRLGAAFGSALGAGAKVCVTCEAHTPAHMIGSAMLCGLQGVGVQAIFVGDGITPLHRFAVRSLQCSGGIHVRLAPRRNDLLNVLFTNRQGGNISRSMERKIENLLAREDFIRSDFKDIAPVQTGFNVVDSYLTQLLDRTRFDPAKQRTIRVAAVYDKVGAGDFLVQLCDRLKVKLDRVYKPHWGSYPYNLDQYQTMAQELTVVVPRGGYDLGVVISAGADHLMLVDNQGRLVQDDLLMTLLALLTMRGQGKSVVVPVTAPLAIDNLAQKYQARVVRTKTAVQDFYDTLILQEDLDETEDWQQITPSMLHFDALAAILKIIEVLQQQNTTLAHLIDEIPLYFREQKETEVPWAFKGTVMRSLIQETSADTMELQDGVKVYHQGGWALVLPDPEEPVCRVFSEGSSMEIAASLADFYIKKINQIIDPVQKIS